MIYKKCCAVINVSLKKALSAKDDDESLYYIIEESYIFKEKKKIRKKLIGIVLKM